MPALRFRTTKLLFQGLLAGIFGASLFFCFFMLLSIGAMTLMSRLSGATLSVQSVIVNPGMFFRNVGLPLGAAVFVLSFGLGVWRSRRLKVG